MELDQDPAEIAKDISHKPYRILYAIRSRGGTTPKSNITKDTGLNSSLINYHLKKLMAADLVIRIDENQDESMPQEGYTYQITDRGEEVLTIGQKEYNMTPIEQSEVRRRLDTADTRINSLVETNNELVDEVKALKEEKQELGDRVNSLEEENKQLQKRVDALEERVDGQKDRIDNIVETYAEKMGQLHDRLKELERVNGMR